MNNNNLQKNRKTNRLRGYDYSQDGFYFVTVCTKNRECFFGEIVNEKMILNDYGKVAKKEILHTAKIRKEIKIDEFVIMPNHLHLIIVIENNFNFVGNTESHPLMVGNTKSHSLKVGNTGPCSLRKNPCSLHVTKNKLSNTIQRIKSQITLHIRKNYDDFLFAWQKSFYDVIIRNEEQLNTIREYIINNPLKWDLDENNLLNR